MQSEERKRFDEIRATLTPDIHRLNDAFERLPSLIMEASERAATATSIRENLKMLYEQTKGNAAEMFRNPPEGGKKPAEAAILDMVNCDPEVYQAWQRMDEAREDAVMWGNLVEALRVFKSCIDRLADFVLSGYIAAGQGSHEPARSTLNAARQGRVRAIEEVITK